MFQDEFILPRPPKRQNTGLLEEFEEFRASNELPSHSMPQSQPNLANEINEYTSQVTEKLTSDPLAFWKKNDKNYPLLAKAARRFLSAPATSLASEGIFSTARAVYTYQRMRLRPRKAEMIIFMNRALPLFKNKY